MIKEVTSIKYWVLLKQTVVPHCPLYAKVQKFHTLGIKALICRKIICYQIEISKDMNRMNNNSWAQINLYVTPKLKKKQIIKSIESKKYSKYSY